MKNSIITGQDGAYLGQVSARQALYPLWDFGLGANDHAVAVVPNNGRSRFAPESNRFFFLIRGK
jgi:hypothetical protein